jgi:hypothetical protein
MLVSPKLDMQRSVGKFSIFLVGVYLLVILSFVVSAVSGSPIPLLGWPIALIPGAAFAYAFIDAVRLHRVSDEAEAARLWRRSLLFAVIGAVLLTGAVMMINRLAPV